MHLPARIPGSPRGGIPGGALRLAGAPPPTAVPAPLPSAGGIPPAPQLMPATTTSGAAP